MLDRIKKLRELNFFSFSKIATILNEEYPEEHFTKDRVRGMYVRAAQKEAKDHLTDTIREWLGTSFVDVKPPPNNSICRKCVAFGDLHGSPSIELLKQIDYKNIDVLIVGGDILDLAALSTHAPYRNQSHRSVKSEVASVRAYLEYVRNENPSIHIILMQGNHDDRYLRKLYEVVPEPLRELFNDPLELVIEGLENCTIAETLIHLGETQVGKTSYLYPFGDILFSHGDFLSAEKLEKWYSDWRKVSNLGDFRYYVQFHTHKMRHEICHGGLTHLIEPGMAGTRDTEEYKIIGQKLKWKPGVPGFMSFEQELVSGDWITDPHTLKIVHNNY
jgi:hypothetical protein